MECCFCKREKATHLDPDMPLCILCCDLRDFLREVELPNETSLDECIQKSLVQLGVGVEQHATVH